MNSRTIGLLFAFALLLSALPAGMSSATVGGTDVMYTTDADFDLGTLVSVNHDAPYNDQLQLDTHIEPFPFINVAASGRGTVVRVNTDTGEVVGEYRTAPEGRGLNPSRTTVDLFGSVWTANRGEVGEIDGVPHGSAVKIGLVVGGTRVDADGTPNPAGPYLAPPFGYNTCVDRDGDGFIRTSSGLLDVLDWPDVTDGVGGSDGLVEDAVDECILIYQRLPDAEQARHVSVDANNNVWIGGFPFELRMFHKLDGATGAILDSFDADDFGCGGYGGLVDGNGILWSIGWGWGDGFLLRYNPVAGTGMCVDAQGGYGLGIDTSGYVWASLWENGISKISPDGVLQPGFPKSTHPPSATTTSTASPSAVPTSVEGFVAVPSSPTLSQPLPAQRDPLATAQLSPTNSTLNLGLRVAPEGDFVETTGAWPVGATVSLTVEDGTGVVYTDTQTVDAFGYFIFHMQGSFDLLRGHFVTVSDGTNTATHTVQNLFVDGLDPTADTVFGRADAGSEVHVWVHGDGERFVTADSSGNWVADFSGTTDLTYGSDGGAEQWDADGSTAVWWFGPRFQVAPDDEWVQSHGGWIPGATISLTVEDGSGVVYSDSQVADGSGYFNFEFWDVFDLQRGHLVTISDGTTTKVHTVQNLFVDGLDPTADTVFGRAGPGTEVHVWVHGGGDLLTTADGSGNWVADFSASTDLTYGSNGGSQQVDDDGDSTGVWWSGPRFHVAPDGDIVSSWERWNPGSTISLTVEDGSGVVYSNSQVADGTGHFNFELWDVFDLQRGYVVTVSDGATTKTHTIIDLHITDVDAATDVVSGTTEAGGEVLVEIHGTDYAWRQVVADGSGNWSADFSTLSGEGDGMHDITVFTDLSARQEDGDGDITWVDWRLPVFWVAPQEDYLSGTDWAPEATISVTIEDGSGVVYSDSVTSNHWTDFHLDTWGFDIETGHVVTVSDGRWTKTHTVTDVTVTDIDAAADAVVGIAAPGAWVQANAGMLEEWTSRWVQADGAGNWLADFSLPWHDQPAMDITDATMAHVEEFDDDGDATHREFGPPIQANRGVAVTPIDNHVWVANSGVGTVTRLTNDGNFLKVIDTGNEPTGVAVDAAGKVWATNMGSNNAVRIDPGAGADGLGAVDLTVDLGADAWPYNYSDMTGAVVVGATSPQGLWTVVQDSGVAGVEWGRITWNTEAEASEPPGTEIVVETRSSDTQAGLGAQPFAPVANSEPFSSFGRYIEVRVTLKASSGGVSPVLSDIRVQPAVIDVGIDIKPGSDPNSINVKWNAGVVPVAVLGTVDFDVTMVDVSTLAFGPAGANPRHDLSDPVTYADHLEDVNTDGFMDLVSHYVVGETGLAKGDTEACLAGRTLDGIPFKGCDAVRIVGKK